MTSDSGQTAGQSSGTTRLSAITPTSMPFGLPCNRFLASVSWATLLLPNRNLVCCVHQLNPHCEAVFGPKNLTRSYGSTPASCRSRGSSPAWHYRCQRFTWVPQQKKPPQNRGGFSSCSVAHAIQNFDVGSCLQLKGCSRANTGRRRAACGLSLRGREYAFAVLESCRSSRAPRQRQQSARHRPLDLVGATGRNGRVAEPS